MDVNKLISETKRVTESLFDGDLIPESDVIMEAINYIKAIEKYKDKLEKYEIGDCGYTLVINPKDLKLNEHVKTIYSPDIEVGGVELDYGLSIYNDGEVEFHIIQSKDVKDKKLMLIPKK